MKFVAGVIALLLMLSFAAGASWAQQSMIIDHTCTDLSRIPSQIIEQVKNLTLHYAHTSHGGQIPLGLQSLEALLPLYGVAIRYGETEGLPAAENPAVLRIYDGNPPETYIGPGAYWDGTDALNRTRAVAATGHYGFSMFGWCGEMSWASEAYVDSYLSALDTLESEFPGMRFIYMTGHLDGSGSGGNLHQRNEQIRAYCRANSKVLFDFADIERFNPDGTDYLDLGATDNCDYSGGNWANQWCAAHPGSELCSPCADCIWAHTQDLNCNLKARAFWWMMARLAGWDPNPHQPRSLPWMNLMLDEQ